MKADKYISQRDALKAACAYARKAGIPVYLGDKKDAAAIYIDKRSPVGKHFDDNGTLIKAVHFSHAEEISEADKWEFVKIIMKHGLTAHWRGTFGDCITVPVQDMSCFHHRVTGAR